jgi:drug/metabolite transporter (DMT)-like permease
VAGIALAIVAIGLVSLGPMGPAEAAASRDALPLAIAAGVLFGLFYVCFARVHEDAGLWPVAISRLTSATVLVALAIALTGGLSVGRAAAPWVVAIGALEVAAAVTLLLALQRGPVSVASVLASLYPVTTTFLAALVLRERLRGVQLAGVALALVAVALISS